MAKMNVARPALPEAEAAQDKAEKQPGPSSGPKVRDDGTYAPATYPARRGLRTDN